MFAFAQNRHTIGYFLNFIQLVGYENNGFTLISQIAHYAHQLINFLRSENSSGFIKNQNLIFTEKHFENLNTLLLTDCNVTNLSMGINRKFIAF